MGRNLRWSEVEAAAPAGMEVASDWLDFQLSEVVRSTLVITLLSL